MRTVAIVQARMGSRRLPGKVMAPILGEPMLAHVLARVKAAEPDETVVATSELPGDDVIERFCSGSGIACFRGSETDVLDRYHRAAAAHGAEAVVRITSDCPLLDPEVVGTVMARFRAGSWDYVTNTIPRTFPDGLDIEVFSFEALGRAWEEATDTSEREHVTAHIRSNPDRFTRHNVTHPQDLSHHRWTVDTADDLAFVRAVYQALGAAPFGMHEVLALLAERPELPFALESGVADASPATGGASPAGGDRP